MAALSFGSVRAYRFDGLFEAAPVVLLAGRNAATRVWDQASNAINGKHPRRIAERAGQFWAEIA